MVPAQPSREDRNLGVRPFVCAECEEVDYAAEENGHSYPLPAAPTRARAGSAEKVEVMRRRAESGESVFHPRDNLERERAPGSQTGGAVDRAVAEATRALPRCVFYDGRKRKYRVRLWDRATRTKVSLGLYDTVAQARAALAAGRRELEKNRANEAGAKAAAGAAAAALGGRHTGNTGKRP